MINDPAWFLSSLAQASAGLIGLLGAVLILRLQQQSVAIQESRNHVLVAFAGLRSTLVSIERGLSDFLEWVPGDIAAIRSALADGQTMRQVQQERDGFGGGSRSGPPLGRFPFQMRSWPRGKAMDAKPSSYDRFFKR